MNNEAQISEILRTLPPQANKSPLRSIEIFKNYI